MRPGPGGRAHLSTSPQPTEIDQEQSSRAASQRSPESGIHSPPPARAPRGHSGCVRARVRRGRLAPRRAPSRPPRGGGRKTEKLKSRRTEDTPRGAGFQVPTSRRVDPLIRRAAIPPFAYTAATWGPPSDRHADRACSRERLDQTAPAQGGAVGHRLRRRSVGAVAGDRLSRGRLPLARRHEADRDPRSVDRPSSCAGSSLVSRRPRGATGRCPGTAREPNIACRSAGST